MKENNILDVGCGSGFYQDVTKRRGHINFDILKPKDKIKNFVLGDAHKLPFRNNAFDVSFFIDVIEHVNNPYECLKELKRVTSNKILVGTPNCLWFPKILRSLLKGSYEVYPDHIVTFGIPEFKNLLNRVGFTDFSITTMSYREDRVRRKKTISRILTFSLPNILKGRQIFSVIKTGDKK